MTKTVNRKTFTRSKADKWIIRLRKRVQEVKVVNAPYISIPLDKPENFVDPDGNSYPYTANDASVADLDGDGEYEIILRWDANGKDNSHKGITGECLLDAYKLDGTKLWRINLGRNIRSGSHYTQFMVYDFNNDGKAELVCKTADATVDGKGNVTVTRTQITEIRTVSFLQDLNI